MNRQEVVIALAKINMMNKQVAYWMDLDQDVDNIFKVLDIDKVPEWKDGIVEYMKNNQCHAVVNFTEKMFSIDYLKKTLKERKKRYLPSTIQQLTAFANAVEEIYKYSSIYYKMYKAGPLGQLDDDIANEKTVELFTRAIEAGYLDSNYRPKKKTTNLQLKTIAWAVGKMLHLPMRKLWAPFERQWQSRKLSTLQMPEKFSQEVEDIKVLYPEVDYSPLTARKEDEFFKTPKDECRVEELFLALVAYGYIDRKTTYDQFKQIFGIKDAKSKPFKPVNWLKEQRNLTYFVHYTFGKTNKDIWVKAKNCFNVNGKIPNKGSMKSGIQALKRDWPEMEKYDPCLLTLAQQFNRKE